MFQGIFKQVSSKGIQFESMCVSRVFQGYFKKVSRVFLRRFQGFFKGISRKFYAPFKQIWMVDTIKVFCFGLRIVDGSFPLFYFSKLSIDQKDLKILGMYPHSGGPFAILIYLLLTFQWADHKMPVGSSTNCVRIF